jgi:ribonuclease P protein component
MMQIATLKRSAEFQRIRGGLRWSGPGFLIEGKARTAGVAGTPGGAEMPRFGFTITKKIGGAVERNRIRRRLKAVLRSMPVDAALSGFDYVIVARGPALDREFAVLTDDFRNALKHIRRGSERASKPAALDASQGPASGGGVPSPKPSRHNAPHDPNSKTSPSPTTRTR